MTKENNYEYPIEYDWTTAEITDVIKFYNLIEAAYEGGADTSELIRAHNRFRSVVPMKMDQNNLAKRFETESGYSIYKVMKEASNTNAKVVKF